jgi:hypothetical protein
MKGGLVIVAAIVLLAGCGRAVPKDPFTGTWRAKDGPLGRAVISKRGDHYRLAIAEPGTSSWLVSDNYTRRGNVLVKVTHRTNQVTGKVVVWERFRVTVDKASGNLVFQDNSAYVSKPIQVTFTKVSDSTASPTPSSTPLP